MVTKLKNVMTVCVMAVFLFGCALFCALKPDEAFLAGERRAPAPRPGINVTAVFKGEFMEEFETYALDNFPLRDRLRTLKAAVSRYAFRQRDDNGIYMQSGHVSKLEYPVNHESIDYAAGRFRFIYERYLSGTDTKVYCSVIPDKNYFMAASGGYPSMDYGQFILELRERMDFASYIDITQLLELSDYYNTDIHWRQEKITDVAETIAAQMGSTLSAGYDCIMADAQFYGVYYSQYALPLEPDSLCYLESGCIRQYQVYDYETDCEIPVYDLEKAAGRDAYEMFLSGSKSILTIENPAAVSRKELVIFRDSFGSSLAPLLAEGYTRTTLVDIRYISPELLGNFLSFDGQDVLFLYSTPVLNHSMSLR